MKEIYFTRTMWIIFTIIRVEIYWRSRVAVSQVLLKGDFTLLIDLLLPFGDFHSFVWPRRLLHFTCWLLAEMLWLQNKFIFIKIYNYFYLPDLKTIHKIPVPPVRVLIGGNVVLRRQDLNYGLHAQSFNPCAKRSHFCQLCAKLSNLVHGCIFHNRRLAIHVYRKSTRCV